MKSLKRTLSLTLVFALVFSLMSFAFAAEPTAKLAAATTGYTDAASIQYNEAVDVMTGIKTIEGMGDGTFAPQGTLTRAQAAKMVAYAALGSDVASTLPVKASSYKDVNSNFNWAIPSIEYLTDKGVIEGYGDGNFGPNDKVTANQLAKMLLIAVGYGKNGEYTGSGWELNAAVDASKLKLYAGTKATSYSAPATREEAALYCFNTLTTVPQVNWSKDKEAYEHVKDDKTIGTSVYGLDSLTGVVTANSSTVAGSKATTVGATIVSATTGAKLLGHAVAVYFQDANGNGNYDTQEAVYSVIDNSTVVTVTAAIDSAAKWTAAFGTSTITNTLAGSTNLFDSALTATTGAVSGLTIGSAAPAGVYVLKDNDIVSYIEPIAYQMDKVSNVVTTASSEAIVLAGAGSLANNTTSDVVNEYDGIAKGDVVFVSTSGAVKTLYKPVVVTGKITKTVTAGELTTYTVNGTDYTGESAVGASGLTAAEANFTGTFNLYLAPNGMWYALTAETVTTTSSVVYATKPSWTTFDAVGNVTYNAQVVNAAGEVSLVKLQDSTAAEVVNDEKFVKLTASATVPGAYTVADAEDVTDLIVNQAADQTIAASTVKSDVGSYYFASDVKFVFYDAATQTTEVKTGLASVIGVQIKDGDQLYFNDTVSANKTVSTVFVLGKYSARLQNVTGTNLLYIPAGATEKGATAAGKLYDVYIDGVKTEAPFVFTGGANMSDTDGSSNDVRGTFINYTVNANGAYVLDEVPGTPAGTGIDATLTVADGIYGTLITTTGFVLTDANAANATIVDLTGATTPITSLAGIASSGYSTLTLAVVYNTQTNTVSTIYITAAV